MQKKAIGAIVIAVILLVVMIPVSYAMVQRSAITSLKFHFNRAELGDIDFSGTQTIGQVQEFVTSLDHPGISTLSQYASIESNLASYTPEMVALDLLINTKYSFNMFLDVSNPSAIEAVIDKAQIKVAINGHELPGYVTLAQQKRISPGDTKTIELQGIAVSGKDIANILYSTVRGDFVFSFDFDITSYFPTLFGDVPVPAKVNLNTYPIPPKPTFSNFNQVAFNENSYDLSLKNENSIPLSGRLEVGILKGNSFGCNPNCFAPVDNGLATFLRIKGSQIFDIQVLEYDSVKMDSGGSFVASVTNPGLRNNANSAFIIRWAPDLSVIPYTVTTQIAGVSDTSTGEFHSSSFGTVRSVVYNLARDFGYVGSKEFVSPNVDQGGISQGGGSFSGGSGSYLPQIQTASISIQASSYSVTQGDTVTFSGRLVDQSGDGISGETVSLKVDRPLAIDSVITTGTTDSRGQYSFAVTFDTAGSSNIYAIFEGSSEYGQARSQDVAIQVSSTQPSYQTTSISLIASSYHVNQGDNVQFSGKLVMDQGYVVKDALIYVKQDKTLAFDPVLVSGNTASDGTFSLTWTVNISGTLKIYAVFDGSSNLSNARSQEIQITVS